MAMSDFERHKFVSKMPPLIRINVNLRPIGGAGAINPDYDVLHVQLEDAVLMMQQFFTTGKRIHGILHYEGLTQLFFMGYECNACHKIFLVPDTVVDDSSL